MPSDTDITVYESIKSVLGPLHEFTDAVSGEKQVTISCVQPVLWKMFELLTVNETDCDLATEMKQILANDLKQRYSDDQLCLLLDCATYLDARFKNTFVADADKVKQKLLRDITELASSTNVPWVAKTEKSATEELPEKRPKLCSGLVGVLARIKQDKKQSESQSNSDPDADVSMSIATSVKHEFSLYDELQEAAADENPLEWWKKNAGCFKLLPVLAKKYLCIGATSVASERVFSTSGNVVNAKRSRLSADTVDMLTFLAKNLENAEKL